MAANHIPFIRILLVGDSGVGSKTTVLKRYCKNEDHNGSATIGIDFAIKETVVDGVPVKLQVWGLLHLSTFFLSFPLTVFVCLYMLQILLDRSVLEL